MASEELRRAYKLFIARKFTEVIRLLEPQVFRYRENFTFYYLLGVSCLYVGDFGGAFSYLQRANQLKHNDCNVLYGLASVYIKRGEIEKALKIWLKLLDLNPGDNTARYGIELARRIIADKKEHDELDKKVLVRLYPKLPVRKGRIVFFTFIVLLISVSGLMTYLAFQNNYFSKLSDLLFESQSTASDERNYLNDINLDRKINLSSKQNNKVKYKLDEKEIENIFSRAKKYLLKYRDNLAIVEINRLLLSNASPYVKEKARLLKTFVIEPDFTTLKDSFDYQTVIKDPRLYNDCYVIWRGKITNIKKTEDKIKFDFLIGYESEKELKGIVEVNLDFPALIDNGDALEILGQIKIKDSGIILRGISIHKLYMKGN